MNGERLEACSGKRRFTTFADALRKAKRARRAHHESFRAYHCQHCNGYHIGAPAIRPAPRRLLDQETGELD